MVASTSRGRLLRRAWGLRALLLLLALTQLQCPRDADDALMLQIYRTLHQEIHRAAFGTDIAPAYLAALISMESWPPGNRASERFEAHIYRKLLALKHEGQSWGGLNRRKVAQYSDDELRKLATSYGLVQIMGYHCLDLGCTVDELKGKYQLQWAAAYMQFHYGKLARKKNWAACFRTHNTGRPDGRPPRGDYVERGLLRLRYYEDWIQKKGELM